MNQDSNAPRGCSGTVLLLAAGRGRRFGSDKRRARLPDGRSVLQASIDAIRDAGLPCVLCLAEEDRAHPPLAGPTPHFSADARRGMGATLASGMAQLDRQDFVVVALGDMPWVQPATIRAVAAAARRDAIVVPVWCGRRGHPVAFGAAFFPLLRALDGDRGARAVVAAHGAAVREVSVDDPGVLRDIDRPGDLQSPPL